LSSHFCDRKDGGELRLSEMAQIKKPENQLIPDKNRDKVRT
jgi:hypothetical protein